MRIEKVIGLGYLDVQQLRIAHEIRLQKLVEEAIKDVETEAERDKKLEELANLPLWQVIQKHKESLEKREKEILKDAEPYYESSHLWQWCLRVKGLKEVAAVTYLTAIDPEIAHNAESIHAYTGYTPGGRMRRGEKAKYNPHLKGRIWMVTGNVLLARDPYYKPLYEAKKAYLMSRPDLRAKGGECVGICAHKDCVAMEKNEEGKPVPARTNFGKQRNPELEEGPAPCYRCGNDLKKHGEFKYEGADGYNVTFRECKHREFFFAGDERFGEDEKGKAIVKTENKVLPCDECTRHAAEGMVTREPEKIVRAQYKGWRGWMDNLARFWLAKLLLSHAWECLRRDRGLPIVPHHNYIPPKPEDPHEQQNVIQKFRKTQQWLLDQIAAGNWEVHPRTKRLPPEL